MTRDELIKHLCEHFAVGTKEGSYTYNLQRHKSAFGYGTMHLSDFEEFGEEECAEIASFLIEKKIVSVSDD